MIESNEHIPESADNEQLIAEKLSFVDRHAIHPLFFAFASLVSRISSLSNRRWCADISY